MPQITVYVRQDDLAKWKAVEKKSEFLHNALNRLPAPGFSEVPVNLPVVPLVPARAAVQPKAQPIIKTKDDAVETIKQMFPEAEFIEPLYRDKKKGRL